MENQAEMKQQKTTIKKQRPIKKGFIIFGIFLIALITAILLFVQSNKKVLPQDDTFYAALYQNKPVLFYKYEGMVSGLQPITKYEGVYVPFQKAFNPKDINTMMSVEYVDFDKLQNRQKLFTFDRFATIENIMPSDDKNYLAISFTGGPNDTTNYLYQVNLNTGESKKIWQHEQRTGESPYNMGFAYITNFVPDKYIVFEFIKGNPPPAELPAGVVIKNIQTGKEKVLGVVGDVRVDEANNTVFYKTIAKTLVPCVGKNDPACFAGDTHKNAYAPVGEVHTQPLP